MDKQTQLTTTSNKGVVTSGNDVNNSLQIFNLFDEKKLAEAEIFLKRMISTEKGGIKSVNEGLAILMRANDLQLPFSSCVEHIHVINGKTGIDIHIIKALLSRAGVVWNCIKDYAPQYQYTDGNNIYNDAELPYYCVRCRSEKEAEEKTTEDIIGVYPVRWYIDLKGQTYNQFQLSDKVNIALNKAHALKLANEGKYAVMRIPAQAVDYVTEYEFTRYRIINGVERITKARSHFSYTDAIKADLLKKETYMKYTRTLVSHRAFTLGARDIADDLIMGLLETTELKLINDSGLLPSDFDDAETAIEINQ